ncbi:hypothetical protein HZA97_07375 [Candidatus Woesearchaeota archaeon]|nr:hypothetical protein [Candidatus Woesearchaeota archaeon]
MTYDKSKMIYCKTRTFVDASALFPFANYQLSVDHDEGNWTIQVIYHLGNPVVFPTFASNEEKLKNYQQSLKEKKEKLSKLEQEIDLIIKRIKNQ